MAAPLLVVVDMQRVFAEPASPWHVPTFADVVDPISRLVAAFGDRVVFTRFIVPEHPEGSWRRYYREFSFITEPSAKPLLDLAPPFDAWQASALDKPAFSAYGPELQRLAGSSGTLVLCGVSTECCVLATAIDAVDHGTAARIVSDASASVDADAHRGALHVAEVGYAPMITITTVAEELSSLET